MECILIIKMKGLLLEIAEVSAYWEKLNNNSIYFLYKKL